MIINNINPLSKIASDATFKKLYDDIQGNILKSHARPNVQLLFLNFSQHGQLIKNWIREKISPIVTSFSDQLNLSADLKSLRVFDDNGFCSFSLSKKGYDHLQILNQPDDISFQKGLGNGTITNDPQKTNWEDKYQEQIHAVIILGHTEKKAFKTLTARIKSILNGFATVVAEETGEAIPGEKEHFGFSDGRSQPRFFIEDIAREGAVTNWNPFAPLSNALVKDSNGKAFDGGITGNGDFPVEDFTGNHSYGSYLVFRKLEQDIDGWNNAVAQLSTSLNSPVELAGAYAVGRFKDGTPVTNHSTAQAANPIENDFDYAADMAGAKCPFHAHIRKANPRGDTIRKFGVPLEAEKEHRISRRGIPYIDNNEKKGLLFMCYQNSIVKQFDFMQNRWVDDTNFLNPGVGIDDVIGQGTTTDKNWPVSHGAATTKSLPFGKFVTMKGGEYFFTPAISFLKTI